MFGSTSMFAPLSRAFCLLIGSTSPIIGFIAGAAVLVFFAMLALNEGNSMMSWGIKILIGVAGLVGATSLISSLFPAIGNMC